MKHSLTSAALIVGALAASPAMANIVVLDNFNIPAGGSAQGTVVNAANPAPRSTTSGNRTITITNTTPSPLANSFDNVTAVVNGDFRISNPSLTNSTVVLSYTLAASTSFSNAGTNGGLLFDVISRDRDSMVLIEFLGTGGNNLNFGPVMIPSAPPASTFFLAMTASQIAAFNAGGTFRMTFTGVPDYDVTIDNLRVSLPVPGSVTLLGLGLLGLIGLKRRT